MSTTDGNQTPPASYLDYKYAKAVHDYERVHSQMLGVSPNHSDFHGDRIVLQELRFAIDDLLADLAAAWDALQGEAFDRAAVPPSGTVKRRLALLADVDATAADWLDLAWTDCFCALNDARNHKQHEGFWPPDFAVGQGDGPFAMDLLLRAVGNGGVHLIRESRLGLLTLARLDDGLALGHDLARHRLGCGDCFPDGREGAAPERYLSSGR